MKKESLKTLLVFFGAILFNIIFWKEKMGINTLLLSIFILACIAYLYPYSIKNTTCRGLFAAHLLTAAMIIFHNTVLSRIAFSTTMVLFISFSQYLHRSVWYAGGSVILNYAFALPNFIRGFTIISESKLKISARAKPVRILLLPLLIVTVFLIIYAFANTMFSHFAMNIATAVENCFTHFFDWFSFGRFGFFLLGIFIMGGLILAVRRNWFSATDNTKNNNLLRKKSNFIHWKESAFADLVSVITGKTSTGMLALKTECTIGMISLILLNFLLLIINIIDVKYVWAGLKPGGDAGMAAYVHEGAGLLILSILLAMLLLLFFFRGNLNFYKKSNAIRYGAYGWIFQNMVLVLSVLLRNYYYISHYGLTYKRIGLLFFLAMVLVGLITVFLKIYHIKTTYFLLRVNAWAGIFLLVFASAINWDVTIANYNLARKSLIPVDVHFLLSLSDATLPLIEVNKNILDNHREGRGTALQFFDHRKQTFIAEQNTYSWLSWNAADAYVLNSLKTPANISVLNKNFYYENIIPFKSLTADCCYNHYYRFNIRYNTSGTSDCSMLP